MSDTTIVHLLRHGEVDNPGGIIYGRLPGYHLSANGQAMAEAAADYFSERAVVALFCSPLERAQETAREAAAGREAVCVTHQLPIWVTRRTAEGRRLWHNPAMRECALGSVTSFTYSGDRLAGVSYTVPARRQVTQDDAAQ